MLEMVEGKRGRLQQDSLYLFSADEKIACICVSESGGWGGGGGAPGFCDCVCVYVKAEQGED